MKKLALAVILCCAFSIHGIAINLNDIEDYALYILIENDMKDIDEVILNSSYEAYKATVKAEEAYFKAKLKDVQSFKIYVTKTDALKTFSIEAKTHIEAKKVIRHEFEATKFCSEADNSSIQNMDTQFSKVVTAEANAAKTCGILRKTETKTIKSSSKKAIKLYNKVAKFYDKAAKSYGDIVIACSINTAIIRTTGKEKGSKDYIKYEAYIAAKGKVAETWAKREAYAKKLKTVAEAYARVATVRIELSEVAKTYAKAAKTYAKAAKTYAKAIKNSVELPKADKISCFEFDDAVELHKAHKISDVQLASSIRRKASYETMEAYAAYCRTNLKLTEAILAACCEEAEAIKLKTELNKSSVEQAQDTVQHQAACLSRC